MGVISLTLPSDGDTIDAADVNVPFNTIQTVINGNLDANNLATGAVTFPKVASGMVVQVVSTGFAAVDTTTLRIPLDDTIPQITEGKEFMTQIITPKAAANILIVEFSMQISDSVAGNWVSGALFQDAIANALAASTAYATTTTGGVVLTLIHTMTAGTTSATTFRVRGGGNTAGTSTFNGQAATRNFGAIPKSGIKITEYKA